MSSAGHIIDMINRMKYNRSILKKRKKHQEIIECYHKNERHPITSTQKPYTKKAKQKISYILKNNHERNRKRLLLNLFLAIIITSLFIVLFYYIIIPH